MEEVWEGARATQQQGRKDSYGDRRGLPKNTCGWEPPLSPNQCIACSHGREIFSIILLKLCLLLVV